MFLVQSKSCKVTNKYICQNFRMDNPKTPKDSLSVMTQIVLPNDTNALGNLMGGVLLKWMDIAAGIAAGRHSNAVCVTVSVDNVSFKEPIKLGEVVLIEAKVTRAFNTSMEIYIEVFREDPLKIGRVKTNDAFYTFVALDDVNGSPTEVRKIVPETDQERELFEGAERRREVRLILGGKMEAEDSVALKKLFKDIKN